MKTQKGIGNVWAPIEKYINKLHKDKKKGFNKTISCCKFDIYIHVKNKKYSIINKKIAKIGG